MPFSFFSCVTQNMSPHPLIGSLATAHRNVPMSIRSDAGHVSMTKSPTQVTPVIPPIATSALVKPPSPAPSPPASARHVSRPSPPNLSFSDTSSVAHSQAKDASALLVPSPPTISAVGRAGSRLRGVRSSGPAEENSGRVATMMAMASATDAACTAPVTPRITLRTQAQNTKVAVMDPEVS